MFPETRMRRLRRNETFRRMVRETTLRPDNLIQPLFVRPGTGVRKPIASMPGQFQWSVDTLAEECKAVAGAGVPAVILFGIPDEKDPHGSAAWDEQGIVCQAIEAVKRDVPGLCVITDVCMCEYTDHGHCGAIADNRDGVPDVDNDATLGLLVQEALAHVRAGADMVAPSDMMDGRVAVIREALDEEGYGEVPIMAYSAKFASAYYGPFRDAAESPPQFGDRRSYQMDPANTDEALREIALDIDEGADIIMVKPALPYLDIIRRAADKTDLPIAAYNVSGEYAMVEAAAANGWIDRDRVVLETLLSIRRAGARMILTYWAREFASKLG